ncbi:MAG: hypothetical protein OXU61_13825, partial [Gammaproteobacteria bacterium]|nr:hypothetical protein [Gammaproteobacteria bacterium]
TVSRGSATGTLRVTLVNDAVDEPGESLTLTLQIGTGYELSGTAADNAYTLRIDDDDTPQLRFVGGRTTIAEDAAGMATVTVTATPAPRTALAPRVAAALIGDLRDSDYSLAGLMGTASPFTLSIPVRTTETQASVSATFTLDPMDDDLPEGTEGLRFTLQAGGTGDYGVGAASQHVVVIRDNEAASTGVSVSFMSAASSAAEGGTATVRVDVTGLASGMSVDVLLRVTETSVAASDYSLNPAAASGVVTLAVSGTAAATDSATLTVTASDDALDELDETLALDLENSVGNYVFGAETRHTVTITDTDMPEVSFAADGSGDRAATVSESSGSVDLTVAVAPAPAQALTVGVQGSGTATAASDYTLGTLTVSRGSATGILRVTLVNNTVDEPGESLTLTLQGGTGYELSGTAADNAYTLRIDDDDTPQLRFVGGRTTIAEDAAGMATVTVTATPAPRTALAPRVAAALIGDLRDSDYSLAGLMGTASPFTLSIPVRTTETQASVSATFTLDPMDDDLPEGTEGLRFTLQAGGTGDYGVGAASQHVVVIRDNEAASTGVSVSFMSAASSAAEGGTATVRVDVTGLASGMSVDVLLRVTETSVAASDYSLNPAAASGVVTLAVSGTAAATDSATLTVTASDDALDELDETLALDLENSVGNYVFGAETRHTVTITDTDMPEVSFAADGSGDRAATVSESSGSVDLTVAVAPAPAQALTVGVQGSGTATAASDYTLGTLTVSRGSATGTLRVTLVNDAVDEPGESL